MINETEILHKLPQLLALNPRIAAGAGDDCAVINMQGDYQLLAAADQLIENIHFLPETSPFDAGKKLMNRNLSDIAAMGGKPLTALLTIAVNGRDTQYVEDFISGAAQAGQIFDVPVCGGDTASLPAPGTAATLTILGEVPHGKAVMRSGAKPGELIYVTGEIGNSFDSCHHLHFVPRLKEGLLLREHVSAMLDISDGLLLDARRLAEASQVTLALDIPQIPLRQGASLPGALADGEDYELFFTSPLKPAFFSALLPCRVTCIGRVIPQKEQALVTLDETTPIAMENFGYVHR